MADQNSKNKQNGKNVKKKKRRRITVGQLTIFIAIVIGVVLFLIINAVMRNRYLKVTNLSGEYVLGTNFDIKNYVEPVNENAVLECDTSSFTIDEVGFFEVEYTVKCGKLKRTNTVTVEAVDRNYPEINGPDTLGVVLNETVNLLNYYTVYDEEPDLEEELLINKEIDTSETGYTEYTLGVTDWGNNYTSKEITIVVYDLSGDEAKVAIAVREFNGQYGYAVSDSGVYVYYPDESSEDAYVLINDSVIFEVDEDGSCTLIEDDEELNSEISENGTWVDISGLGNFNYNANN